MEGPLGVKIYEKMVNGVRVLLYHREELFHSYYEQCFSKSQAVRMLAAYNQLLLLILQHLELRKCILFSKDWTAGVFATYAKHTELAPVLHQAQRTEHDAVFFPIAHNLGKDYEGRIHLGFFETTISRHTGYSTACWRMTSGKTAS